MEHPGLSQAAWRKSSACAAETACIEVAVLGKYIGIRDSADTATGATLLFNKKGWLSFITRMSDVPP
jgi:hypothetical protein